MRDLVSEPLETLLFILITINMITLRYANNRLTKQINVLKEVCYDTARRANHAESVATITDARMDNMARRDQGPAEAAEDVESDDEHQP